MTSGHTDGLMQGVRGLRVFELERSYHSDCRVMNERSLAIAVLSVTTRLQEFGIRKDIGKTSVSAGPCRILYVPLLEHNWNTTEGCRVSLHEQQR